MSDKNDIIKIRLSICVKGRERSHAVKFSIRIDNIFGGIDRQ